MGRKPFALLLSCGLLSVVMSGCGLWGKRAEVCMHCGHRIDGSDTPRSTDSANRADEKDETILVRTTWTPNHAGPGAALLNKATEQTEATLTPIVSTGGDPKSRAQRSSYPIISAPPRAGRSLLSSSKDRSASAVGATLSGRQTASPLTGGFSVPPQFPLRNPLTERLPETVVEVVPSNSPSVEPKPARAVAPTTFRLPPPPPVTAAELAKHRSNAEKKLPLSSAANVDVGSHSPPPGNEKSSAADRPTDADLLPPPPPPPGR